MWAAKFGGVHAGQPVARVIQGAASRRCWQPAEWWSLPASVRHSWFRDSSTASVQQDPAIRKRRAIETPCRLAATARDERSPQLCGSRAMTGSPRCQPVAACTAEIGGIGIVLSEVGPPALAGSPFRTLSRASFAGD